jgi:predicted DsbA family dithiol-disulfide isomerase
MRIDVWSDLVCPWCYIGKRRLERALADFDHRDEVEVVHRSFQLRPDTAAGSLMPRRQMLKEKYHLSDDQVETMDEKMERLAADDGLDYNLSGGVSGNTLDAHRLVHHARTLGQQDAVVERLFRAYFTEQRSIFERDSLVELATEVGVDPTETRRVLSGDAYAEAVKADHDQASALGARGVPFFVLDGRYGISGAQSVETFGSALQRAWSATHANEGQRAAALTERTPADKPLGTP